ncbi:MAG TPA: hypothetical protein VD906_13265 [Caulobacteraceae bacterium]|nr:hypothetical protein [Caulobacteraceae bacterium]
MQGRNLIAEAEAAERLADIVSYEPDKRRLRGVAQRLREEAHAAAATPESRSWAPRQARGRAERR